MAAPLLIAWPYAAVSFLGTPANRDDMSGIRIAAAICRRATFVLMAFGMIAVPFSFRLGAHLVLDFPGISSVLACGGNIQVPRLMPSLLMIMQTVAL